MYIQSSSGPIIDACYHKRTKTCTKTNHFKDKKYKLKEEIVFTGKHGLTIIKFGAVREYTNLKDLTFIKFPFPQVCS